MSNEPAEELAINTDKPGRWRQGNPAAAQELAPRPTETAKSAWAHGLPDGVENDKLFEDGPPIACRELQALALFILRAHKSDELLRNRIEGVSIRRSAFPAGAVENDTDEHIAARFDPTHRSIQPMTESVRETCFSGIQQNGSFATWRYTRTQFHGLIQYLLEKGYIRQQYEPLARRILESPS